MNRWTSLWISCALFGFSIAAYAEVPVPVPKAGWQQVGALLASSSGQSLLVWFESTLDGRPGVLRAVRIIGAGPVVDREPILVASNAMYPAAMTTAGDGYFVAWDSADGVIHGRRIERDGTLGDERAYHRGSGPALAENATEILLAFEDGGQAAAMRIEKDGGSIDQTPLFEFPLGFGLQTASNGSDFFVVWETALHPSPNLPANQRDIYGVRVSSTGGVDAAPLAIATGRSDQGNPNVASDGRDYLVIYTDFDDLSLLAKRVLREGVLADTTADAAGQSAGPVTLEMLPVIRRNERGYLVGWLAPSTGAFWLRQVDGNGVPEGFTSALAGGLTYVPWNLALSTLSGGAFIAAYSRPTDGVSRVYLYLPAQTPRRRAVK